MARYLIPLLFFTAILSAQQPLQFVKVLDGESGLSHSNVTALLKDKRGFLWVGTENGLNRYDGNEIKTYLHRKSDTLSLPNDFITGLLEDKEGYIWVGTTAGLAKLNPANGKCENFTNQNGKLPGGNFMNTPFVDEHGDLWTANQGGIYAFNKSRQSFIRLPVSDSLSFLNIAVDKHNIYWVGGYYGLQRIDPVSGSFERIPHYNEVPNDNKSIPAVSIKIDRFENIWVKSWAGGLYRFQRDTKQFEQFKWVEDPDMPGFSNIPFDITETFDEKRERTLWIAVENGIIQMPLTAHDFPSFKKKYNYYKDISSFNGAFPKLFLLDGETLWTGGPSGLFHASLKQQSFKIVNTELKGITTFDETTEGELIINSVSPALAIMDIHGATKHAIKSLPPHIYNSDSRYSTTAVEDPESGIIYAGSFKGITAYDPKTGRIRWFTHRTGDTTGLLRDEISHILPLGKGRLLVALWRNKLQIFDTRMGKNIRTIWDSGLICRRLIRDSDGTILICAEYKLLRFDPISLKMKVVLEPPSDESVHFWDALSDSKGIIWVATNQGLWLFDTKIQKITARFDKNDGLPGNMIFRVVKDSLGRIWLNTDQGLCYFNTTTRRFFAITQKEGLIASNGFDNMQYFNDGNIWFSFKKDLYYFKPEHFTDPLPSKIYITGLKINERDSFFSKPFEQLGKIVLSPGQNVLSFSFTAIDLESPGKTNFLYRLEGLQKNWVEAGKTRLASFVNVPAGTYTFRVRPEDAGENNAWDAVLCVVITDYFWQRMWFKIMAVVILTAVITGLFFVARTRQLRLKTERLKAEKEIETAQKDANRSTLAALRAFINPHFLFNVLNAVQASILRKTPLEASSALGKFAELMRRTLEHAQKETAPLAEELELLQLYLESQQLRFENAFDFSITTGKEVDADEDFLPTMILQPFVENAIEHGLLLKKNGKGFLKIQVDKTGDQLCCLIEDNGIGRAKAAEMAAGKRHPKTSQGTRITEERLRLLSGNNRVEIEDLYAEDGRASGTRVRLWA